MQQLFGKVIFQFKIWNSVIILLLFVCLWPLACLFSQVLHHRLCVHLALFCMAVSVAGRLAFIYKWPWQFFVAISGLLHSWPMLISAMSSRIDNCFSIAKRFHTNPQNKMCQSAQQSNSSVNEIKNGARNCYFIKEPNWAGKAMNFNK